MNKNLLSAISVTIFCFGCINNQYISDVIASPNVQKQQSNVLGTIKDTIEVSINELGESDAIELIIETDSGKLISIIQEISTYSFQNEQRVRIIKRSGRSRVVPFS